MARISARRGVVDFMFSLVGRVLVWLAKQLAKLIAWLTVQIVLHPRTSLTSAGLGAAIAWVGWRMVLLSLVGAFVATSTWSAAHRASFERYALTWARTWWRRWWAYRRVWDRVMVRCELFVDDDIDRHVPRLVRVSTTPFWDRLVVRMEVGQELEQFRQAGEKLRGAFGAHRVAVREIQPAQVGIDLMRRDPLVEAVEATEIPASTACIDFRAVPVGFDEFDEPYCVSLLGGHTSVAGSTGAGKAGLGWNLLRGIAPGIADGTVRLVGIDPKAKELRQARALFADSDYAVTEQEVVDLLVRLVVELGEANERDAVGGERDFAPSPARPLTLILIDELAPLLKYWPRSVRSKIEDLLGILLTQGRAAGYIVVGAIQEPTKDTFTLRDLFTRRIALRLPTESHTEAALIEDAVQYGALCHQVSETMPGVLFSLEDGARSTVRARLGYVRDDDIRELVEYVTAARSSNVVDLDSRRQELGRVA
ncbi:MULTISPECIES: hypothetical protein [unclassified Micromonospora]|uniref:hypothetical protein n=1 Tax=unclassified Micromonospora TaxID=2617518 RepID=UPI00098D0B8C|nr:MULTISPECIES: hypothetical protein [unclassified Micromonospora]MDI5937940.1 hypothetical protein [Micromonospora sp. DH15]OON27055.1 hypothetical protein BSA16_34015 [Micromonospora sp. Rc5]